MECRRNTGHPCPGVVGLFQGENAPALLRTRAEFRGAEAPAAALTGIQVGSSGNTVAWGNSLGGLAQASTCSPADLGLAFIAGINAGDRFRALESPSNNTKEAFTTLTGLAALQHYVVYGKDVADAYVLGVITKAGDSISIDDLSIPESGYRPLVATAQAPH